MVNRLFSIVWRNPVQQRDTQALIIATDQNKRCLAANYSQLQAIELEQCHFTGDGTFLKCVCLQRHFSAVDFVLAY